MTTLLSWLVVILLWVIPSAQAASLATSPNASLADGATAFAEGQYEQALELFSEDIKTAPDIGYSNRCHVFLTQKRYTLALQDCTTALGLNPNRLEPRLNLGLSYQALGEYEAALFQYHRLLQSAPDDHRAYYNIGLVQALTGQQQQAIDSYTQALAAAPQEATILAVIYRDRGVSHLLLANYAAAIHDLTNAIERDPDDLWAHFDRGCAYHRSQALTLSLQEFDWVIARQPDHAQAHFNRGMIYAQRGEIESAIAALQQSLQYAQTDALLHHAQQLLKYLQHNRRTATAMG